MQSSIVVPSTTTTEYDAIVVGAGYGGLITGAILSRNGLKALVVDELDQVGGRGGATFYHGYWLDWGHRDARDFGDNAMIIGTQGQYGKKAAEAAGADIAFVGPVEPNQIVHLVPEGRVIVTTSEPESMMKFAIEVLGVPPDQATKFLSTMANLATQDPQKFMAVTFKEWFASLEKPLRKAFLDIASIMVSLPPEDTSVGRFIQFLRDPIQCYRANDPEVGGMQGFMEPYARAIRKYGGRIELGLKTFEILVKDKAVRGIVTRDKSNTVQEFQAPVVVFAEVIWDLFKVVDESLFPQDLVENARRLEPHEGDTMCMSLGLSRLPSIRATGQPDDSITWNRVLLGPERRYSGGWFIPTLISEKQAPPGKHLLCVAVGTAGAGCKGYDPIWSFEEGKSRVEPVLHYMRRYYQDLDEITEWMTYNLVKAPTFGSFFWKPIPRAPLQAPTVKGLFFVGETTEVDGCYREIGANAALHVSNLILKGFEAHRRGSIE